MWVGRLPSALQRREIQMKTHVRRELDLARRGQCLLVLAAFSLGCGAAQDGSEGSPQYAVGDGTELASAGVEDGLADAYQNFVRLFASNSAEYSRTLKNAVSSKDKERAATMAKVLTLLDKARSGLFDAPPTDNGAGG